MKKIYYFPGLISALLVPVLFWYYINPHVDKTVYNVIDFALPIKLAKDKSNFDSTLEPLRKWSFKRIKVDSGKAKENSKLYVSEIQQLQQNNEKNTAIEFILNEQNTYGYFVYLLNDMAIAKHESYALDMDKTGNFLVPVIHKSQKMEEEEFECLLCDDVIRDYEDPSITDAILDFIKRQFYSIFFEDISKLPKGAYYIIFGFLLFLNISMLSIKERFQLQRVLFK
jgi:hypothetical protein